MVTSGFVPDRGDLLWTSFDPMRGHEQAGSRPALVLTPRAYNEPVSMALICPITSRIKGYPFELTLPAGLGVTGAVLCDQVRSVDWRARKSRLAGRVPEPFVVQVVRRIGKLIGHP